jgi:acyl-coenzyme A thioesterase PaaI-like protein
MALVHHELCFGCGRTNLFGLMLELEHEGPDSVIGRCFIKQDHQGADRWSAHEGVIAAALSEAMALLCGPDARAKEFEVELRGAVPVGEFLVLAATAAEREGNTIQVTAIASAEGRPVASARGRYATPPGS